MRRRSGSAVLLLSPTSLDESNVAHVLVSQIVASIITLVEACQGAWRGGPRVAAAVVIQLQTEKRA